MRILHYLDYLAFFFAIAAFLSGGAVTAAGKKEKRYDLTFKRTLFQGQKIRYSRVERVAKRVKVFVDGKLVLGNVEKTLERFDFTRTVVKISGGRIVLEKIFFDKATNLIGEKEVPYGFEDKVVMITAGDGGKRSYTYEDGAALSEDEMRVMERILAKSTEAKKDDSEDERGDASPDRYFMAPKKPVKVGETWQLDVQQAAKNLIQLDDVKCLDMNRSSAAMTLQAIRTRNGHEFGFVKGEVEIFTTCIAEVKFKESIPIKVTMSGELSVGGVLPDCSFDVVVSLKSRSDLQMKEGAKKAAADIDLDHTVQSSIWTVGGSASKSDGQEKAGMRKKKKSKKTNKDSSSSKKKKK